jgi:hypothetical protein
MIVKGSTSLDWPHSTNVAVISLFWSVKRKAPVMLVSSFIINDLFTVYYRDPWVSQQQKNIRKYSLHSNLYFVFNSKFDHSSYLFSISCAKYHIFV